jgi:uncharacterized protein (TIGR03435 family)
MLRNLLLISLLSVVVQERTAFEVASIKPHEFSPGLMGVDFQPGGRVIATQVPLPLLILSAYHILPAQLQLPSNLPDEIFKVVFDIEAKPEANAIPPGRLSHESEHKLELMLQTLLADRFKLQMHIEKKELPVYALLVDKNGLKLPKAAERDCDVMPSPCRWERVGINGTIGHSVTLQSLAEELTFFQDRGILNKTGIEGRFDIELPPFTRGAQTPGTLVDGRPADLSAPSLAAVLQDVGLRLEPRKEIFDIYIVDHIEKPSAN